MQCVACLATFDSASGDCPTCRVPLNDDNPSAVASTEESFMNTTSYQEPPPVAGEQVPPPVVASATSTLIEFPGTGRANRPLWRKELSERVREIQQRRALDAAREAEVEAVGRDSSAPPDDSTRDACSPQLGLVPPSEPQELNPIVAKALERIERARHQQQLAARQTVRGGAGASAAAARTAEESYHVSTQPRPAPEEIRQPVSSANTQLEADSLVTAEAVETPPELARATNLVIVPPPVVTAPQPEVAASEADALINELLSKPRPRRHIPEVADDALLTKLESAIALPVADAPQEERRTASLPRRIAGGVIDLVIVAFASSPFAAIIEITNGTWHDPRVSGSLAGVVAVLMFVYLTATVAFSGRTWGMALVSLRAADDRSGLIPTVGQCARRAVVYMLSLAPLGAGLLLALFDRERRAPHDRLSNTVVINGD